MTRHCTTRSEVGLGINNQTQSKPPSTETFDDDQDSALFAVTALGEDIAAWVERESERVSRSSPSRKRSAAGAEKGRARASSWKKSSDV